MAAKKKARNTATGSATRPASGPASGPDIDGHEDFYKRLRDKIAMWADRNEIKPTYRKYLLALPDMFHLSARLALDRRVDKLSKILLGVALAYVVLPYDLLPDFLGPLGFVDDLLVVALVLETVLARVPAEVIREHWAGDGDLLGLVREIHEAADKWVGRGMYLRVREYLAKHGVGSPAATSAAAPKATRGRKTAASSGVKPSRARKPAMTAKVPSAKKATSSRAASAATSRAAAPKRSPARKATNAAPEAATTPRRPARSPKPTT